MRYWENFISETFDRQRTQRHDRADSTPSRRSDPSGPNYLPRIYEKIPDKRRCPAPGIRKREAGVFPASPEERTTGQGPMPRLNASASSTGCSNSSSRACPLVGPVGELLPAVIPARLVRREVGDHRSRSRSQRTHIGRDRTAARSRRSAGGFFGEPLVCPVDRPPLLILRFKKVFDHLFLGNERFRIASTSECRCTRCGADKRDIARRSVLLRTASEQTARANRGAILLESSVCRSRRGTGLPACPRIGDEAAGRRTAHERGRTMPARSLPSAVRKIRVCCGG